MHLPRTRFSHLHFVSVLVPAFCHSCSSGKSHLVTHGLHAHAWLKHNMDLCALCLAQNRHISLRNVIRLHLARACGTCTPSLTRPTSFSSDPLLGELQPCADLRQLERGSLAEPPSLTSYEPKDHKLFTEDKHPSQYEDLAEQEDLRVKPLFFHQPSIASTCDSAESIATPPPDSDLDDDQIRALLASSLFLHERETNAERSQVYHSARENLMSSSSQYPLSTGRTGALLFSSKNRLNSEMFSDKRFSMRHQQALGNNAP